MEILLHSDILLGFLKKNISSADYKKIYRVLDNDYSRFLFSKKFLGFIKNEIPEDKLYEFQSLLKKFSDTGINIPSSPSSTNIDEELVNIYSNSTNNVVLNISYSSPSDFLKSNIPNIAILLNESKPNFDWIVLSLATFHPNDITVKWFGFRNNNDIRTFFNNLIRIPKRISHVTIFDKQTLTFNPNIFSGFLSMRIHYYTIKHRNFLTDVDSIKKFFRNLKIYTTINNDISHGRRILFENLIIYVDNDFNNLKLGSDWFVNIVYAKEETDMCMATKVHYREYNSPSSRPKHKRY